MRITTEGTPNMSSLDLELPPLRAVRARVAVLEFSTVRRGSPVSCRQSVLARSPSVTLGARRAQLPRPSASFASILSVASSPRSQSSSLLP